MQRAESRGRRSGGCPRHLGAVAVADLREVWVQQIYMRLARNKLQLEKDGHLVQMRLQGQFLEVGRCNNLVRILTRFLVVVGKQPRHRVGVVSLAACCVHRGWTVQHQRSVRTDLPDELQGQFLEVGRRTHSYRAVAKRLFTRVRRTRILGSPHTASCITRYGPPR